MNNRIKNKYINVYTEINEDVNEYIDENFTNLEIDVQIYIEGIEEQKAHLEKFIFDLWSYTIEQNKEHSNNLPIRQIKEIIRTYHVNKINDIPKILEHLKNE